jgi:hypothetical protein
MSRKVRGGLVLPLVLVGCGVLFLLTNLGVIEVSPSEAVARYWPILVISLGIDLALGRFSLTRALSAAVTVAVLLALAFVVIEFFGSSSKLREEFVRVNVEDAVAGRVALSCEQCALEISRTDRPGVLIEGEISSRGGTSLDQRIRREAGAVEYELDEERWGWLPTWTGRLRPAGEWVLRLSESTPLDLTVSGGRVSADLSRVDVGGVNVTASAGPARVTLSDRSTARYVIAADSVELVVPAEVAVRVEPARPLDVALPVGYAQTGSIIVSSNWEAATIRATVLTGAWTARLSIESRPNP